MSFAASNQKNNNNDVEESTPEMRSVSLMSAPSQSQTPRFSALPPLKSSSSLSSFPSPLSKSSFPSPLSLKNKTSLPPPLKKSTFSAPSLLVKTTTSNSTNLEWKLNNVIPTLPEYYHLGRSCTTVSNCENGQIITSQICEFLNKQSLSVTFEENIATCITSCQTKFLIKIFKEKEEGQFIVEVQRMNGCSYVCQKYCRAILRTAMESASKQEQQSSSSSSSRVIKSYEFKPVPASVIAQAEHDKQEKEIKKGPIHQQNDDDHDDDANLSSPSFRSTTLKFPSPFKNTSSSNNNNESSLKNNNKKNIVQRSYSDSHFIKSRSAMMAAAATVSKSTMSLPSILPEFQPNDELMEFKIILDELKDFKLKYAEAQTEVDHLRNENQRIVREYEEMKAKLLQQQSQQL